LEEVPVPLSLPDEPQPAASPAVIAAQRATAIAFFFIVLNFIS
jgi:hypothetical protein